MLRGATPQGAQGRQPQKLWPWHPADRESGGLYACGHKLNAAWPATPTAPTAPAATPSDSAASIPACLERGGTIENAQAIAAHLSPRTTKLYDRIADEITYNDGNMTEQEEKAVEALIEAGPARDPYGEPVQYMGKKLGLATADARKLTRELVRQKRICTKNAAPSSNLAAVGQVVHMRYVWEKAS